MDIPAKYSQVSVATKPGIDLLERFELFRRNECATVVGRHQPAKVEVPEMSSDATARLIKYIENAEEAISEGGMPTFASKGFHSTYGFVGFNPFGDGFSTGIKYAGMAVLYIKEDGSFGVIIVWDEALVNHDEVQKKHMLQSKAFFEK